jgi:hypothetical protein
MLCQLRDFIKTLFPFGNILKSCRVNSDIYSRSGINRILVPLTPAAFRYDGKMPSNLRMHQRNAARVFVHIAGLLGMLFCASAVFGQAASAGKTRTYYVAADEVNWDYAPSGHDEAMGMAFDDVGKGYTEPGPHQIGRVYKKAIYREYTDGSFSTLKARPPGRAVSRPVGTGFARRSGRHH